MGINYEQIHPCVRCASSLITVLLPNSTVKSKTAHKTLRTSKYRH